MEVNEKVTMMDTNFFTAINSLEVEGNLNLTIRKLEDGNMVVATLLTNDRIGDSARKQIIPLKLTATAQELDKGYFNIITAPLTKASGLMTNMEAYLKSVEEATKKSRMEQDRKKREKDEKQQEKGQAVDNSEVYKTAMEKVYQMEKEMKYLEALEVLPTLTEFPKKEAEIKKKQSELEAKSKLASLF